MARGAAFGRRIRITLGNVLVADIDPAKPELSRTHSLDCSFVTEAHTKLAPLGTTASIIGINRIGRAQLLQQQKAASSLAWAEYQKVLTGAVVIVDDNEQIFQQQQLLTFSGLQLRIEAGYQNDFGLIADAQTMPNGIEHIETAAPTTNIKAQDGRYPWQNGFVNEEVAPGVTYREMALIDSLSTGFLEGDLSSEQVDAAAPELLARKDFAGYANGRVLSGNTRDLERRISRTLGVTLFYDRGQRVYLNLNAVTAAEAVLLKFVGKERIAAQAPTPGGLLSWQIRSRGMIEARSLLNYNLTPGRQVIMQDDLGVPIGEGVFRVEHVRHSGSTFGAEYYSTVLLRPTSLLRAVNV